MSLTPLLLALALSARPSPPPSTYVTDGPTRDLPNRDAFAESGARKSLASSLAPEHLDPRIKAGSTVSSEPRLGVPTFLWASAQASNPSTSMARWSNDPAQVARGFLADFASFYRLTEQDASAAVLRYVHNTGKGPIIAKFQQRVGGLEVFRTEINVVLSQRLELVAISGYLSPNGASALTSGRTPAFNLPPQDAVASAFEDLTGLSVASATFFESGTSKSDFSRFSAGRLPGGTDAVMSQPARLKPLMFDLGDRLEPAYYVELDVGSFKSTDSDYFSYVISAVDGRVLFRRNLTEYDAYTYRVWADSTSAHIPLDGPQGNTATPHPTGLPDGFQAPFIPPSDITVANTPFSRAATDFWLPSGAVETNGNNVDAYADLFTPDGLTPVAAPANPATGDFRAQATTPGSAFTYTYDTAQAPTSAVQRQAAITQLFYTTNFLHDWYYDFGFDEVAGNAQALNYGRGGLEGDSLKAEAQDFGGRNNANMSTPADGARPRMQMYVFDPNTLRYIDVTAPAAIAGRLTVGTAAFGPQSFNVSGNVIYAIPANGCSALTNAVAGKIALIDRGTCGFVVKVAAAQAAGAVAVIIANTAAGVVNMAGTDPTITIPSYSLSLADGNTLKAQLALGNPVTVTLLREAAIDRDGTIDNTIVAHEWGHYISNRLIVNSAGLTNVMGRGMGEGWADFHALLMVVKDTDAALPSNPNWSGVFGLASYVSSGAANNGYYYGIRRVPYSTNFAKNALTFKHIQNGVPLPSIAPVSFGADGSNNAEVHNTGEVWATMLWECYTSLLKDTSRLTFSQAQDRMKTYLVAAYKLTPASPTLVEARDALLAAAYAGDPADYQLFGAAFARRGAGVGAVSPDRLSSTHVGVVESYLWGNDVKLVNATLDDSVSWCDRDGTLDNGETGRLTLQLKNIGAGPLTATTATVFASDPGVVFPNGPVARFDTLAPLTSGTASIDVRLNNATPLNNVIFTLSISDPSLAAPRTVLAQGRRWLNTDDLPASSATDDVESSNSVWTPGRATTLGSTAPWGRVVDTTASYLHAQDPSEGSDQYLVSPTLNVAATGNFSFTFRHRFDFEADPVGTTGRLFYDGGRVELSTDNGTTWTDIGASATPGYNGTIATFTGNVNPLTGKSAYVAQNASYPNFETVTVNLGTAYQGQAVRIRFRLAADSGGGANGWDVDDIAFTGITNTPFNRLVADRGLCVNRRPLANTGANQSVNERTSVTLDGSASSDPDNDALTYAWSQTSGPTATLTGGNTASPTFTAPEVTVDTPLIFSLVVTDTAGNASAKATTTVTVKNVNRAPLANPGVAQTVNERTLVALSGLASNDPENDALTYAWTQTGGPAVTLSNATSAAPTFVTPEVTANTDLTFSLVVSDGTLSSPAATVVITVRNVNRAPSANAGNSQTVDERTAVTLNGAQSTDPEGDSLTYTWVQASSGPAVTLTGANTASPTFTAPDVAVDTSLLFWLVVSDGSLSSSPSMVAVTVRNVNRKPTASAGVDQNVEERSTATLEGGGSSDPDGDALTYTWLQTGGPTVTLSDVHAARPTFNTAEVTSDTVLTFTVTTSDGRLSDTATVRVTVRNVNRTPLAGTGPDQTVEERSTATLDASSSSDPDGDALTYTWAQTAGPAVTLSDIHAAKPTFSTGEVQGDTGLTFTVTVNDGSASSTHTVNVTVHNVNRAPVAKAGEDRTVDERSTVILDASTSTDPDGDALSYTWTQTGGPAVALSDAQARKPSFNAGEVTANTALTFTVTVSDGSLSQTATVHVTIRNQNRGPLADAGDSQTVSQNTDVTLHGGRSKDPDGDALTYAWVQTTGPEVALTGADTAEPTLKTPKQVKAETTLTYTLTVTDAAGATATSSVNVIIEPPQGCGCNTNGNAGAFVPWLTLASLAAFARRRAQRRT